MMQRTAGRKAMLALITLLCVCAAARVEKRERESELDPRAAALIRSFGEWRDNVEVEPSHLDQRAV